jgi:hypothetical protein
MNKKRHILFGITPGSRLKADGHLSDDWLLLAIDGELSVSDYAQVKEHVRACWTCRARKEHLERTIEDIVEYEQALVAPDMPPSAGGRAMFMARLDELAADMGRPSLLKLWSATISQLSKSLLASRMVWIVAVLVIAVMAPLIYLLREPPAVSANELLRRASLAETHSLAGVNQPVVVQKLSIRINGRKLTRTIYSDPVNKRQASRADAIATEVSATERSFSESSLDWNDPLSPKAFGQWREGVAGERDVVTRLSGNRLKLDTTADSGPIAEASLTVRGEDFHPIAEDLHLRDNTQIEIAEVSYDVVGLPTLSTDIFGLAVPAEPLRLPEVTERSVVSVPNVRPDATQLAVAELEVQTVLHKIGADLGEEIAVEQEPNGLVRVDGIVADDSRKQQVDTALAGIPFTQLRVQTIAQASKQQPSGKLTDTAEANPTTIATADPPLLEDQLKKRFPDADQRTEYVNQSLALCQSASGRAWALNRLADRYTPEQIALLDHGSQQQLQSLLADHISALREDVSRLQSQLGQVLSSASNTAAANTVSGSYAAPAAGSPLPDDWRNRVHRVHSSVETTNEAVSALLAGSTEDDSSPDKLQLRLRTTLTELLAELQSLDQQVHKQL